MGSGYRVLVVEDEPMIAMMIEDAIDALGCKMLGPFAQLNDAVEAARCDVFDCAVLDVNICGGYVYPVADLLIARKTPFLLATGYSKLNLPANLVAERRLTKPYTFDELEVELNLLCLRARANSGSNNVSSPAKYEAEQPSRYSSLCSKTGTNVRQHPDLVVIENTFKPG